MKEAPITHSPHAFVPKREMTEEERRYLYRFRLDESFNPYTVIDSLRKVYHRDFSNDLLTYIGTHPDEFSRKSVDWHVSRTWVDSLKIIRPESIFFQALRDVKVDLCRYENQIRRGAIWE